MNARIHPIADASNRLLKLLMIGNQANEYIGAAAPLGELAKA